MPRKRRVKTEVDAAAAYQETLSAYEHVCLTPEGIHVLRHILALSGYQKPFVQVDPVSKNINVEAQTWLLGQREIWVAIRDLLPPSSRSQIENGG